MIGPIKLLRLLRIHFILIKYGLTRPVVGRYSLLRFFSYANPWSFFQSSQSRGASIGIMLEKLGPIFVKFGQLLSTRRDLITDGVADELARLQDQVLPFCSAQAVNIIETSLKQPLDALFKTFDQCPLASASIAQVHAAVLHDGSDVVVKVLRPNIAKIIRHDIALMYLAAKILRFFSKTAKRLKPVELVAEFEQTILNEMDLAQEAANASQLRRNFAHSSLLYVPKVYWPLVAKQVMVMERVYGVRISDLATLKAANTNLKKLAEHGVEIFFTQVLRDSFFHADMHPGNLFVDITDPQNPKYSVVDFGIMGSLSPEDQHYLAANLLAFFKRDYRRVAVLHVESGWVPANTRIDQFEAAMRVVCEPIFELPLKEISFGKLLLSLFRTAERFKMNLQPQLLLLQKTLLNIEGLGRQLYPELDLWQTAKPFLEKWMRKKHGMLSVMKQAVTTLPEISERLLKTPELAWHLLQQSRTRYRLQEQETIHQKPRSKTSFFVGAAAAFGLTAVLSCAAANVSHWNWTWITGGLALLSALLTLGTSTKQR